MYDRLVALMFQMGIDTSQVTPQSTFRALEMDSLSMTEVAVSVFNESGVMAENLSLDMTLGEAVEQFALAGAAQAS
ncbi:MULTISPECIES: phosphopantetheine-binding protein [Streptomyces]|uniref:phosphopantetheine-binding protein n=1 Tax=Streptomyces TaxID=1883 RepID=UPI002E14E5AE|nr:phosphopantetheine-binding protein [Streptomyces sp. NBC_01244]